MIQIKNKLFQQVNLVDKKGKIIFLPPRAKITLNINLEDVSKNMKILEDSGFIQIKK